MSKKKLLITILISVLLINLSNNSVLAKPKHIGLDTIPTMKSIKTEWKKQKGIKYYVIYRKDVTKFVNDNFENYRETDVKMKDYQKIKTLKKTKYVDNSVKENHYYGYVIEAYNRKDKLKYTTYIDDNITYDCPGLEKPTLYNDGTGEFHSNTNKKFYFYHETYTGVEPTHIILYRSTDNKNYKKILTIKNNSNKELKDTKIKKGKTYYYKIRTVKRNFLKKYYSKYSDVVIIPNVNIIGKYKLKTINEKGNNKIIKLTSNKGNGKLTIKKKFICDSNTEIVENNIKINTYSKDNKYWINVDNKGIDLSAKESIYLNVSGKYLNSTEVLSCYEGINYDGPYAGSSQMIFDFANKKAEVKQFFD